jgi:N-acetylmuramoyl-L-alanine amidase
MTDNIKISLLFFLMILFVQKIQGTEYSVQELISSTGAVLQWDSYRKHGVLKIKDKRISFMAESPFYIMDSGETVFSDPPVIKEGAVLFTKSAYDIVKQYLYTEPQKEGKYRSIAAIFIDPGHGGKDPGAIGKHTIKGSDAELKEKDIALAVSLSLGKYLKKSFPEKNIVLSRSSDIYLELEERTNMANAILLNREKQEYMLYISVHVNSTFKKDARGFEAWYLPPEVHRDLLDENTVTEDKKELIPILNLMKEEEYSMESVILGQYILNGLDTQIGSISPNRGLKQESWYVVRHAEMPSVLVEIGFLSHRDEFLLLGNDAYQEKIALGMYHGILDFIRYFESPVP